MPSLSRRTVSIFAAVFAVLLLASLVRLIPHASNFTPIFALTLTAGFFVGRGRVWLISLLSIAAMLISDLLIDTHSTMLFVYAGLAIAAALGARTQKPLLAMNSLGYRLGASAALSGFASFLFFLITNLGVWLAGELYPMTLSGLVDCFTLALPFYRNSLSADLLYGTVFLTAASSFDFTFAAVSRRVAGERAQADATKNVER